MIQPNPSINSFNNVASSVQTSSLVSSMSTDYAKYGGLIQSKPFNVFKRKLVSLFTYIYNTIPTFEGLHSIVSFMRILQLAGPSILAPFTELWDRTSVAYRTVSAVSVAFHLLPPDYRAEYGQYFLYFYIVLLGLTFIITIASAEYLQRRAYLSKAVSSYLAYFYATFAHILMPIALEYSLGDIGRIIFQNIDNVLRRSILIALVGVLSIMLIWLNLRVNSQSLTFRYNSMLTVTMLPQNLVTISINGIGAILSFVAQTERTAEAVCLFIVAVLYAAGAFIPYSAGGFVYPWQAAAVMSSCIVGGLTCIIGGFLITFHVTPTITSVIVVFLMHAVCYFVATFIYRATTSRHIRVLDSVLEDQHTFEGISSPNHFLNICKSGFRCGHPICIDWTIFRLGTEKWPKNPDIWLMFAKYVAIYPEEMQTLAWIYKTVSDSKLKGLSAQCIKQQSVAIARMRETNLSPDLKERLALLHKELQFTKNKLARIWDVAIQGNVAEVESSVSTFIRSKSSNDAMLEHLYSQFPNNRFVTRAYSHYLTEISGDHPMAAKMNEKTLLLQRGFEINADQMHELGCRAFPFIPDHVKEKVPQTVQIDQQSDAPTSLTTDILVEDEKEQSPERASEIIETIDSLKIPSVRRTIATRIGMVFLFVIACFTTLILYYSSYIDNLMYPIQFISTLSRIRSVNIECASLSNRLILQQLNLSAESQKTGNESFSSFNGSFDVRVQLSYSLSNLESLLQSMELIAEYETTDENMLACQNIIFSQTTVVTAYVDQYNYSTSEVSLTAALSDYFIQVSKLVNESYYVNMSVVNSSIFLNPIANCENITKVLNSALDNIAIDVENIAYRSKYKAIIGIIAVLAATYFGYTFGVYKQIRGLQRDKEEAYRCLTSLPKNTVSTLSENLRAFKKKSNDSHSSSQSQSEEFSKRDENIIKVLSSGMLSRGGLLGVGILIAGSVLIEIMSLITSLLLYVMIYNIATNANETAPSMGDIDGAYSSTLRAVSLLNTEIASQKGGFPTLSIEGEFSEQMKRRVDFWASSDVDIESARTTARKKYICNNNESVPSSTIMAFKCLDVDEIYNIVGDYIYAVNSTSDSVEPSDARVGLCFDLLVFPLYETLFSPIISAKVSNVKTNLQNYESEMYPAVISLMVASVIVEVVCVFSVMKTDSHIRSVLKLLLHCNPTVVFQTAKVVKVLAGDFSASRTDMANHNREYYDKVFNSMIDAVICSDSSFKVISTNESNERIFGISSGQFVGSDLSKFMHSSCFSVSPVTLLSNQTSVAVAYTRPDGSTVDLLLTSVMHDNQLIITARDVTTSTRYNQLIEEERIKSDRLLASIIPANLVKRVQAGEKQISFAVQSASIIFIDIVEFTPWCSSLPANTVMHTLNAFYSRMDSLLSKYPTITRIKGIGDCYMAAGGIFSEINQPAEHAKEAVAFGLDAIDEITALNAELKENLKVRVGVNTGGPIVAGVLGTSKPTFEIFGPAINMAQQMEHHGVPMIVHISRPVYELVYGESFCIKERGTIEVKGGQVLTYLASRKEAK